MLAPSDDVTFKQVASWARSCNGLLGCLGSSAEQNLVLRTCYVVGIGNLL